MLCFLKLFWLFFINRLSLKYARFLVSTIVVKDTIDCGSCIKEIVISIIWNYSLWVKIRLYI